MTATASQKHDAFSNTWRHTKWEKRTCPKPYWLHGGFFHLQTSKPFFTAIHRPRLFFRAVYSLGISPIWTEYPHRNVHKAILKTFCKKMQWTKWTELTCGRSQSFPLYWDSNSCNKGLHILIWPQWEAGHQHPNSVKELCHHDQAQRPGCRLLAWFFLLDQCVPSCRCFHIQILAPTKTCSRSQEKQFN